MSITIQPPKLRVAKFTVTGRSPLICHRWSEKAIQQILDKQMKKASGPKEAKDPQEQYEDSLYRARDGYGFPAIAFKAAAIRAAKMVDGLTMTDCRQMFNVIPDEGDLLHIQGEPAMRQDMVRISGGTADIRFRGEFREWSSILPLEYNQSLISLEQLANLIELAGFSVGVGEWRPEKGGVFGRFTVLDDASIKE